MLNRNNTFNMDKKSGSPFQALSKVSKELTDSSDDSIENSNFLDQSLENVNTVSNDSIENSNFLDQPLENVNNVSDVSHQSSLHISNRSSIRMDIDDGVGENSPEDSVGETDPEDGVDETDPEDGVGENGPEDGAGETKINIEENFQLKDVCLTNNSTFDPPLVMQCSNLPSDDGLDIRHGGGGFETTKDKEDDVKDPPRKKQKLFNFSHTKFESDDNLSDSEENNIDFNLNFPYSIEREIDSPDVSSSPKIAGSFNSESAGLMEFDILDEFESNDNEPEDCDSESDSDISTDEIDAMLEEGLLNGRRLSSKNGELEHEEKQKVILKVRGRDHFDVLPEGWIEVTHNSGMPIYLHKQTRVCSVSKPYFLGPGSTRKHEIPISAIPCLHYLKELEKEVQEENGSNKTNSTQKDVFPSAKLESVKDSKESGSLDYLAVREYCKKRFEFQTITVKRFRTWSGRRKHQKQLKQKQRPSLPDSTKLITCPLPTASDKCISMGNNASKREFIMNPIGKSPVCILHEYVQHTLRLQPKYIFKELENARTPYGAVVMINDMEYGWGYGSSKKQAKSEAARAALEVLIPKMKMFAPEGQAEELQDVEFFDEVRVEDPRVSDLSVKAGQPYPYQILLECLKRNYGMGDTEIEFTMQNLKHQKNEFRMAVGKHSVSVVCKNKRDGKHRASQAILQLLHPQINSWGSLLRMYGKGSCKTLKEKKVEEQRITELQSQACVNRPNMSILNKLKAEMLKYSEKMKSKKPIGKLIPEQMDFLSTSDSNLKNVEL